MTKWQKLLNGINSSTRKKTLGIQFWLITLRLWIFWIWFVTILPGIKSVCINMYHFMPTELASSIPENELCISLPLNQLTALENKDKINSKLTHTQKWDNNLPLINVINISVMANDQSLANSRFGQSLKYMQIYDYFGFWPGNLRCAWQWPIWELFKKKWPKLSI